MNKALFSFSYSITLLYFGTVVHTLKVALSTITSRKYKIKFLKLSLRTMRP